MYAESCVTGRQLKQDLVEHKSATPLQPSPHLPLGEAYD